MQTRRRRRPRLTFYVTCAYSSLHLSGDTFCLVPDDGAPSQRGGEEETARETTGVAVVERESSSSSAASASAGESWTFEFAETMASLGGGGQSRQAQALLSEVLAVEKIALRRMAATSEKRLTKSLPLRR